MSEVQNLNDEEAIKKLKSLADEKVSMFCTYLENYNLSSRPMSTLAVDDKGALWFFCMAGSDIHQQIEKVNNVDLLYSDPLNQEFLAVKGTASVLYDKDKIEEYWTPIAKIWFDGGKDDPTIRLIKVEPRDGHYWDTQHGKIVSGLKMLFSTLTGQHDEDGRQGDLKV